MDDKLIPVEEFAKKAGYSLPTVYKAIKTGKLKHEYVEYGLGLRRILKIPVSELERVKKSLS